MLRIAVITRYFPSSGEPWQGRSAYQTLRALAHQAHVHVFYPNAEYPAFLRPRTRLYKALDPGYKPEGVPVTYLQYPAVPLLSRPFNGSLAARELLQPVQEFRPDLLFSIFVYPEGYAAVKLGKKLGIPVIVMGIGSDIHSIADPISAMHTRKVLRTTDFLVTVSEDLRQKALAMGASPSKSRAVVNGCDLAVFHPRDQAEARRQLKLDLHAPTVVYIGRMDLRKGLRELVDASARLRVQRPDLQVYMVGAGPDRDHLSRAVQEAGVGGSVHLLPPCAPDEVATWMTAADVVTLPSYMEGCPNVVLEALACGRPVVATRVGGIPEIMSADCGQLIPPQDAGALAEALNTALGRTWDPAEISQHHSRSWTAVSAELLDIFQSVAAQGKTPVHAH